MTYQRTEFSIDSGHSGACEGNAARFHGLPITTGTGADDVRDEQGDGAIPGHGADLRIRFRV